MRNTGGLVTEKKRKWESEEEGEQPEKGNIIIFRMTNPKTPSSSVMSSQADGRGEKWAKRVNEKHQQRENE